MKREKHKSRLLEAVHETARDLHKLGFIDKRTMREYEVLWRHRAWKKIIWK